MCEKPFWVRKELDDLNAMRNREWQRELEKDTIREILADDQRLQELERKSSEYITQVV